MNVSKPFLAGLIVTLLAPLAIAQTAVAAKRAPVAVSNDDTGLVIPLSSAVVHPAPLEVYLRKLPGGFKIETRRLDGELRDGFIVVCVDNGWFLWPVAVLRASDDAATSFKAELEAMGRLPIVLIAVQPRDDGRLELSAARTMRELIARIES